MQITIIAGGSRGDVQPYVALGKGLKEAGHTVRILSSDDFHDLVTDYGLDFFTTGGSARAVAQNLQVLVEQGKTLEIFSQMRRASQKQAVQAAEKGLVACQDSDLILGGLSGLFSGQALSEKLGIPLLLAYLVPFTPTSAFPSALTPASFWGPFSSLRRQKQPVLYGYSSYVLPHPSDWNASQHVTGYWFLEPPQGWEAPADLQHFLQSGPPPVYIGFGSMSNSKPEETADLVLQSLARAGLRGVLYAGWGGLKKEQLPSTVFMTDSVPHTWLFPRMAAVVHHGGVGTTAAGLAAGVPSIITPFFADQPFWGRRVYELGVGPRPIARRRLTVDNLTEAIGRAVSDEEMRKRAASLGERIRAENGIAQAITIIEQNRG
jgi:sterol 3beta-glucosyltransferase